MPSSPKGTHSNGLPIRLLDDVRPLWGRVSAGMSPTAGHDLRLGIVRPLWGLTAEVIVPSAISLP